VTRAAAVMGSAVAFAAGIIAGNDMRIEGALGSRVPELAVLEAGIRRPDAAAPSVGMLAEEAEAQVIAGDWASEIFVSRMAPPGHRFTDVRLVEEGSPLDPLTLALDSLKPLLSGTASSAQLSSSARALEDEAAAARRESALADAKRKARLKTAAAERAAAARARQAEAEAMAAAVKEETRPFRAVQFSSDVRKQKRKEELAMRRMAAEMEREEAANAAVQLAAAKELEEEARILKRASQIEDARREVRVRQAEAVREAALKAQKELATLKKVEEFQQKANDKVADAPVSKRRLISA